jgi:hypothetical protein
MKKARCCEYGSRLINKCPNYNFETETRRPDLEVRQDVRGRKNQRNEKYLTVGRLLDGARRWRRLPLRRRDDRRPEHDEKLVLRLRDVDFAVTAVAVTVDLAVVVVRGYRD